MKIRFLMFVVVLGGVTLPFDVHAKIALAKVRIQVVDQDGCFVPDAKIWGGFTCGLGMNDFIQVDGVTDTNGVFVAQGKCNEFLRFEVRKEGYYRTEEKIFFGRSKANPIIVDGKWQPYGDSRTVVLKKIQNPVMMRGATSYVDFKIPAYNHWLGFDFDENQFVTPYGNGKNADVLLRFSLQETGRNDYHMRMDISFTNQLFSGAYVMKKDLKSDMASVYSADTNAIYSQTFSYQYDRPRIISDAAEKLCADEYFVFRTRTEVVNGALTSARYGKIYGPWHYVGPRGMSISGVYFNPVLNDTNLEDAETARKSLLLYKRHEELVSSTRRDLK